jgi:hypothetical protein
MDQCSQSSSGNYLPRWSKFKVIGIKNSWNIDPEPEMK